MERGTGQGQVFAPAKPAYRTSMYITSHRNEKTTPCSKLASNTYGTNIRNGRTTHTNISQIFRFNSIYFGDISGTELLSDVIPNS